MKKYRISISLEWDEEDIREVLDEEETFPSDDEIKEWMREELEIITEDADTSDIEFEVLEDKKK